LVDAFKNYQSQGMTVVEAIHRAGKSRFRAILITSITTFVGLIPLMLEQSIQSAFLRPIVISLAFALVVAFFVTLFLVPALLVIGDRMWTSIRSKASGVKLRAKYEQAKFETNS